MNKVYYFTASWCSPCKTFGPLVEQSGIPYQKVDIDNDTELAAKFGVRTVPSLCTKYFLTFPKVLKLFTKFKTLF